MKKLLSIILLASLALNANFTQAEIDKSMIKKTLEKKAENLSKSYDELEAAKEELLALKIEAENAYIRGNTKEGTILKNTANGMTVAGVVLAAIFAFDKYILPDPSKSSGRRIKKNLFFAASAQAIALLSKEVLIGSDYKQIIKLIDAKEEEIEILQNKIRNDLNALGLR